ncbi:MAG: hypothetical protein R2795_09370 [Saprospiraceae bacterium]
MSNNGISGTWSPAVINPSGGSNVTATFTPNAGQCANPTTITVVVNAQPVLVNVIPTDPSDCGTNDGSIVVNATGSNLEYSIDNGSTWVAGNTFTNLGAGNYTILIREVGVMGCNQIANATLVAPSAPIINNIVSVNPSDCGVNNGSITINATSTDLEYSIDNGITWQSSNTFDNLPAGNYNIRVRVMGTTGCDVSDAELLIAPMPLLLLR